VFDSNKTVKPYQHLGQKRAPPIHRKSPPDPPEKIGSINHHPPHVETPIKDLENSVHAVELVAEIPKDNEILPDYDITQIVRKNSFIQFADH